MLEFKFTNQFKRDIKRAEKRRQNLTKLWKVIDLLCKQESLPERLRNHKLKGNWEDFLECHIEPDFLLIYKIEDNIVHLAGLGSHSDLFK